MGMLEMRPHANCQMRQSRYPRASATRRIRDLETGLTSMQPFGV